MTTAKTFDVFRAARAAKGAKTTTVKVAGAKLPMTGMPTDYTPAGYAALAAKQEGNIVATLPKVDNDEGLSATTKVELPPATAAQWCNRDTAAYGDDKPKAPKGDKAKGDKHTPDDRGGVDPALNGQPKTPATV